jgi:penicillin G amidase
MSFLFKRRGGGSLSAAPPLRWIGVGVGAIILVMLIVGAASYIAVRRSLPIIEGELSSPGLSSSASIERDALGVPAIRGSSRNDVAFACGVAHAQDRFFQMDLLRRSAAGELSALLGASLISVDKSLRRHRFRAVAEEVFRNASEAERELLLAYTAGVNVGLDSLRSRPWEYLLLRSQPKRWQPQDSVLVGLAMYLSLNDASGRQEIERARLKQSLPPELFAFLHPIGTEWDAPIVGRAWRTPDIPGAEVFDLRTGEADSGRQIGDGQSAHSRASGDEQRKSRVDSSQPIAYSVFSAHAAEHMPGSNSWAVAGTHAQDGAALLANDMHLGLQLPNVWYQARLLVESESEERRDLAGVMLPGLPLIIVGSNSHVAWGYTNSYGDWTDLITIEVDPADASRYLTPDGSEPFQVQREEIEVHRADSVSFEYRTTRWGPITDETFDGKPLALAWTAHHPRATNLGMFAFERARSIDALLAAANQAGSPVQNVLAVDTSGRIGWSLMGQIPIRGTHDATLPSSWRDASAGWKGWRDPLEYPRVVDPPAGRLWTANTRVIDAQTWIEFLGEGGYDLGARAAQIRDTLLTDATATSQEMAALQIDDRALFLNRWRDLLLELVDRQADSASAGSGLSDAKNLVQRWSSRAAAEDPGYRIVRAFRNEVRAEVFSWLTSSAQARDSSLAFAPSPQFEGPLWALVTQRPEHLLHPRFASWESALLDSLQRALAQLEEECEALTECTWGAANRLSMRHPLSRAVPLISHWVDMAQTPMSGDAAMPRVQAPSFGASQRLVISPGREERALFQMPGGPVSHPLSPFYAQGHEQWLKGESRPLHPGQAQFVLRLTPH